MSIITTPRPLKRALFALATFGSTLGAVAATSALDGFFDPDQGTVVCI
jgi:hypothetical protein